LRWHSLANHFTGATLSLDGSVFELVPKEGAVLHSSDLKIVSAPILRNLPGSPYQAQGNSPRVDAPKVDGSTAEEPKDAPKGDASNASASKQTGPKSRPFALQTDAPAQIPPRRIAKAPTACPADELRVEPKIPPQFPVI
jgi:hypothetical protein